MEAKNTNLLVPIANTPTPDTAHTPAATKVDPFLSDHPIDSIFRIFLYAISLPIGLVPNAKVHDTCFFHIVPK